MRIEIKLIVDVEMDTESDGVHVDAATGEINDVIVAFVDEISDNLAENMVEVITNSTGFCVKGLTLTIADHQEPANA